jgi:hypothetical protein
VGKYLLVLLVIWVPNLVVNFYQEVYGSRHSRYEVLIEVPHSAPLAPDHDQVMVLLTSLQGFLNAAVYCWGHKSFRKSAIPLPFIP